MVAKIFELNCYLLRRQVIKLFGAGFHAYDENGEVIAYSKQKAFKLKEDIRVFSDDSQQQELLSIQARQIIDFSACYDIVDPTDNKKIGAARRKGFTSMFRDSWEILDASDRPIGQLQEDSSGMAMLRRFINIIPQTFYLEAGGGRVIFRQHFNPFIYKLSVEIPDNCNLDRRLIFAAAVLIAAIEGRQK